MRMLACCCWSSCSIRTAQLIGARQESALYMMSSGNIIVVPITWNTHFFYGSLQLIMEATFVLMLMLLLLF